MKIEIEVDIEHPECTSFPYWIIIDPKQMMEPTTDKVGSMLTGPFFSRQEANDQINTRRHAYSNKARVYCLSGYYSGQYKSQIIEKFGWM